MRRRGAQGHGCTALSPAAMKWPECKAVCCCDWQAHAVGHLVPALGQRAGAAAAWPMGQAGALAQPPHGLHMACIPMQGLCGPPGGWRCMWGRWHMQQGTWRPSLFPQRSRALRTPPAAACQRLELRKSPCRSRSRPRSPQVCGAGGRCQPPYWRRAAIWWTRRRCSGPWFKSACSQLPRWPAHAPDRCLATGVASAACSQRWQARLRSPGPSDPRAGARAPCGQPANWPPPERHPPFAFTPLVHHCPLPAAPPPPPPV